MSNAVSQGEQGTWKRGHPSQHCHPLCLRSDMWPPNSSTATWAELSFREAPSSSKASVIKSTRCMRTWLNFGSLLISTALEKDTPSAGRGRKQGRTGWGRLLHPLGDQLGEGDRHGAVTRRGKGRTRCCVGSTARVRHFPCGSANISTHLVSKGTRL